MSYRKKDKNKITELVQYTFAIVILLIMVLLVVSCYKVLTENQSKNDASRVSLSYISNKIHAYDETGKLEVGDGKYGTTIVLKDNDSQEEYETRIYAYQGVIYEEYRAAGSEMDYESANVIADSNTFEVVEKDNQIEVKTDEGQVIVALRAEVIHDAK